MALMKLMRVGEELEFDLSNIAPEADKNILMTLTEKAGKIAVLKITAHRSINIIHHKQNGQQYNKGFHEQ